MKRESLLAVKMRWSFVRVLSNRLRATADEAIAQEVQPFARGMKWTVRS